MILDEISIAGFRNLADGRLSFSPGLNIFQGENGQGKTNLMETIYLLGSTRSFRRQHARQLIKEGMPRFVIGGRVESGGMSHELQVLHGEEEGRVYEKNGKQQNLLDYIGTLQTIAFTGDHLRIVRGSPEERRNFVDRGISGIRRGYLKTLVDYRRAVRQKNRYLAGFKAVFAGNKDRFLIELACWNERVADLGSRILLERAKYVLLLRERVSEIHRDLYGGERQPVNMGMRTPFGDEEELAAQSLDSLNKRVLAALEDAAKKEMNRSVSLIGPHRDDISFTFGDRPLKQFGSSGQQRGYLLAAKVAKAEIFRQSSGAYPLFIFDDFESELDRRGRMGFLQYCRDRFQLFIAVSADELDMGPPWSRQKTFRIRAGAITEIGNGGAPTAEA